MSSTARSQSKNGRKSIESPIENRPPASPRAHRTSRGRYCCTINGRLFNGNRHFSRAILHYLCIFNGKNQEKVAISCAIRGGLVLTLGGVVCDRTVCGRPLGRTRHQAVSTHLEQSANSEQKGSEHTSSEHQEQAHPRIDPSTAHPRIDPSTDGSRSVLPMYLSEWWLTRPWSTVITPFGPCD